MIQMKSKDFSFVGEKSVGQLYHLFEELNIKPNLTQNGAITFTCVLDNRAEKIEKLAFNASGIFDVDVIKGLSLLTIRHFTKQVLDELTKEKSILLQQQTTETVQVLMQ